MPCGLTGCAKLELFASHKDDNSESAYQMIVKLRRALFTSYYIDIRTIESNASRPFNSLGCDFFERRGEKCIDVGTLLAFLFFIFQMAPYVFVLF